MRGKKTHHNNANILSYKLWFCLNNAFLLTTITYHQDYSQSDSALMSHKVTQCYQDHGNVTQHSTVLFFVIKTIV